MLKENEKRTFWIVVMGVAAVSLVSAWLSSFIVSLDCMINTSEYLGEYADSDYTFSIGVMLLVMFVLTGAAVAHLATKGRNCKSAKIAWASVIGGFFLLTSIIFTIVYHTDNDLSNCYSETMLYITDTLAIALSYELAFLAQCMLGRKPKQDATQEPAAPAATDDSAQNR